MLETTNRAPIDMVVTKEQYLKQPRWDPWNWIGEILDRDLAPKGLRFHMQSLHAAPLKPHHFDNDEWRITGFASQARIDTERIGL